MPTDPDNLDAEAMRYLGTAAMLRRMRREAHRPEEEKVVLLGFEEVLRGLATNDLERSLSGVNAIWRELERGEEWKHGR